MEKVAIVTGGSSGIGLQAARALRNRGCFPAVMLYKSSPVPERIRGENGKNDSADYDFLDTFFGV